MKIIFKLLKKIVLASLFIYSFDVFTGGLDIYIPINLATIFLVVLFDVPAMFCLVLFFMTF